MYYAWKTLLCTFYIFFYVCLHFHVFLKQNYKYKFKCFAEVYPIEVNPIEVYPIEANLIGKGVVEISGCHQGKQYRHRDMVVQGESAESDVHSSASREKDLTFSY